MQHLTYPQTCYKTHIYPVTCKQCDPHLCFHELIVARSSLCSFFLPLLSLYLGISQWSSPLLSKLSPVTLHIPKFCIIVNGNPNMTCHNNKSLFPLGGWTYMNQTRTRCPFYCPPPKKKIEVCVFFLKILNAYINS